MSNNTRHAFVVVVLMILCGGIVSVWLLDGSDDLVTPENVGREVASRRAGQPSLQPDVPIIRERIPVVLTGPYPWTVLVIDRGGVQLQGANCAWMPEAQRGSVTLPPIASTNTEGVAVINAQTIQEHPAGRLIVSKSGYKCKSVALMNDRKVIVVLQIGEILAVSVLCDGLPAKGVLVHASAGMLPMPCKLPERALSFTGRSARTVIVSAVTDRNGMVTLDGLPWGHLYLHATKRGLVVVDGRHGPVIVPGPKLTIRMAKVSVVAAKVVGDSVLCYSAVYPRELQIPSRVLPALNNMVEDLRRQWPGALILAGLAGDNVVKTTAPDGIKFGFRALLGDRGWVDLISHIRRLEDVAAPEVIDVTPLPKSGAQVTLKVAILNPDGHPSSLTGARIWNEADEQWSTVKIEHGQVLKVSPGMYHLRALSPMIRAALPTETFLVESSAQELTLNLKLHLHAYKISVEDELGSAPPRGVMSLRLEKGKGYSTIVTNGFDAHLTWLPEGKAWIEIDVPGYKRARVRCPSRSVTQKVTSVKIFLHRE